MENLKFKIKSSFLPLMVLGLLFGSCNKDVKQYETAALPTIPFGLRIASTIESNPDDFLYYRLIVKAGLVNFLNDSTKTFTIFATNNAGMRIAINRLSGGLVPLSAPDAVFAGFINSTAPDYIPQASAAGIINYNTVGQSVPSSLFPTTFPNSSLPSQIILAPTLPFLKARLSVVKGTPFSYLNNIPLTGQLDQLASNGIIHHAFTLVAPPSPAVPLPVLKNLIANEPTLSYFRAAVARGDSGSVGTARFDSLLNFGLTNMTVLAPNDAAMQPVLFGVLYQGLLAQNVPMATAFSTATSLSSSPAGFNFVPVSAVRGIIAYHLLASPTAAGNFEPNIRVFSVNVPTTPAFVKTLVNGAAAAHPGVRAEAVFSGPFTTSVKFTGLGTIPSGGTPYSGTAANVVAADKLAVNGVYHIIDRVLLPQ